ncbi:cAMP-regulated D2 protein-like [Anneissia japonica]|uniref:cAMP-regulated D2 protein-like n=1 Tax=Anneissia japonica TaxID=1529436 RepID=UPI0014257A72|nr:cAMP-regulated D2 protein-like [Anneissia japonica]
MQTLLLRVWALAFHLTISCVLVSSNIVVQTNYGKVEGFKTDKTILFYGIPYAAPPERWRLPVKPRSWEPYTIHADHLPPGCPQVCDQPPNGCPDTFSEDCLYLNIFTPVNANPTSGFPVMVFIHGGSFVDGGIGARIYDGRFISNMTETVVVTISYRLGALGFAVFGNGIDGNFGFMDQQFALQFIQENIGNFGGDPDKVTLFGQSAGAQSVSLHLVSNSSSHLFHRAIVQSNPFTLPFRKHTSALYLSDYLAAYLGCPLRDVACMRRCTADDIVQAQKKAALKILLDLSNPLQLFEAWGPTVGGDLIPKSPMDAVRLGIFQQKPLIVGSLTEEGRLFVYKAFTSRVSVLKSVEVFLALFRQDTYRVLLRYVPYPGADNRNLLARLLTDYAFTCSTRNITREMVKQSVPVLYSYIFDHAFSFKDAWGKFSFCRGHVCHSSDLPFVFHDATLAGYKYTNYELNLADDMVKYWANFAHSGDPNQQLSNKRDYLTKWLPYTSADKWAYMHFKTPWSKVETDFQESICDFWDQIGYEPIRLC